MLQCVGGDGEGAKERGRVTKEAAKQSIWRKHTEVKGQGFFCSSCNSANARVPANQLLRTFKGQNSRLERCQLEGQEKWC